MTVAKYEGQSNNMLHKVMRCWSSHSFPVPLQLKVSISASYLVIIGYRHTCTLKHAPKHTYEEYTFKHVHSTAVLPFSVVLLEV